MSHVDDVHDELADTHSAIQNEMIHILCEDDDDDEHDEHDVIQHFVKLALVHVVTQHGHIQSHEIDEVDITVKCRENDIIIEDDDEAHDDEL